MSSALFGRRRALLGVVFLALLLDNLLMTCVVPIVPEHLYHSDTDDLVANLQNDLDLDPLTSDDELASMWWFNHSELTSREYEHIFNVSLYENFTDLVRGRGTEEAAGQREGRRTGFLFASKAVVQLVVNPFIGPLVDRVGCSIPLCGGSLVILLSSLLFALGESYAVLFTARAIQGLGSSCTAIAGMSLLAEVYGEDEERSRAMGIALGGMALGVVAGYPMGSVMYEFLGKMSPFLVIAGLVALEIALQITILQPRFRPKECRSAGTSLLTLLQDPYILLVSGAIMLPEMSMALLESTLPLWLIDTINPPQWQLGMVFLPDSVGLWLGCTLFGVVAIRWGRWLVTALALFVSAVCLCCVPLATKIWHLVTPHFFFGLSLGAVDAALMPLLALLVETRHVAAYGNVYAIGQVSISLAFAVGPSLGGQMFEAFGFPWLLRGAAIATLLYLPACYFLRQTPNAAETQAILNTEQGQTATEKTTFNYKQLEEN